MNIEDKISDYVYKEIKNTKISDKDGFVKVSKKVCNEYIVYGFRGTILKIAYTAESRKSKKYRNYFSVMYNVICRYLGLNKKHNLIEKIDDLIRNETRITPIFPVILQKIKEFSVIILNTEEDEDDV